MIIDKLNRFADAVATGNTGTRVLGDVIDLGTQRRDMGVGETIGFRVQVDTAIAAGSGGTWAVKLTTADDAALSTNAIDLVTSATLDAAAGVAAGTVVLNVYLPSTLFRRYLGVKEVVGTANTTAGKIDAFLCKDLIAYNAYEGVK